MHLAFLGGAGEIGASCCLLTIDGVRVLVDAGVRMGNRDSPPNLDALRQLGGPDAIVITHAHVDHSGALPLVHQLFPSTPIFASEPTVQLLHVLLLDSARLMAQAADRELDCPLYDVSLVSRTLAKVVPVPFGGTASLPGRLSAHFFPAGHILGAAMVAIAGSETVLFSGDVSGGQQRTVPGMLPPSLHPDVLVLESTYGSRVHPPRREQEEALVQAVADVVEAGGHALIPAFAVGRAQEVALILRAAQEKGSIPRFPVWLDGMVRPVSEIYSSFPTYLRPPLDRIAKSGQNPFFTKRGCIRQVTTQRERVLAGPPACIIASSGMLSGGPSAFYAAHLAASEQNAIFLCGYQDEESPGRRLLDLAEGPGGILDLPDGPVEVKCRVGKYSLSAHADQGELSALVRQLDPGHVALVHGDAEARAALAGVLNHHHGAYLPENGSELELWPRRRSRAVSSPLSHHGAFAPLVPPLDLGTVWERAVSGGMQTLSPHDVAATWYGPQPSPSQVQEALRLLRKDSLYFTFDSRSGLYRPRPRSLVDTDRRRQEAMKRLQDLPGRLCIAKDGGGTPRPAVAFARDDKGFHAWMVGRPGTYCAAEQLLEIVAPWEFHQDPPDAAEEKIRLHRFIQEVRPLFRALNPQELRERMRSLSEPLPFGDLAATLAPLVVGQDSLAFRLALAWRLNANPEFFERVELAPGHGAYRARAQAPAGPAPEEPADGRMEENAALAEVELH